ncbi:asparagine synthase (glutamine-hydrolyzing) [Parasulfuritortus cantonensis]|uniref:asparagine synthase (glutamine-hydrolyzing) n=1 Tax=Parasulfuritortus cantonensis TaxID=2528202 RepID=A0A4R1BCM7_9PROT|nr:asparagine synthase (glutamine-hydrolyzing) [Parasulfuritortus cantonensis]TCJ14747.1 asparagine synthase (glutamine-hydrolyzing) [Parasulfuritortus cantonensis]
MCGILGVVSTDRPNIDQQLFDRMLDTLRHRGPDGRGVTILDNGRVWFGHRRLAIIDLSPAGAQPMCNEDGTVWITFNGEIYNYRLLRAELSQLGHRFRSESDTEVIVHAWEAWGKECVHRLRGIFAFGIWDEHTKELFLARDHVGVKPLYYSQYAGRFTFASQPRAILEDGAFPREIDATGFRDYFAFGYVPRERSAFAGMRKLPAGHWLHLKAGRTEVREYWHPEYRPARLGAVEAVTEVQGRLVQAIDSQLVSDVPVGCFLSGGIDSSLLVAVARRTIELRTFTVGFDESSSDERVHAQEVATRFATEHHEQLLGRPRVQAVLYEIAEYYDEPFDPNGPMPFMEVARLARRHETVVALGGDGADELFLGYLRYDDFDRPLRWSGRFGRRLWYWARGNGLLGARALSDGDMERYFRYEGACTDQEQAGLLTAEFRKQVEGNALDTLRPYFQSGQPALLTAQLADISHYLVDHILCKVDRAAMAHGVEARVPFLDIDLIQTALSLPIELNYARGERKSLLKRAARAFLGPEILTPRKKGFSSPLASWLDADLRAWGNRLINDGVLVGRGVVRPDWENGLLVRARANAWASIRTWWLLVEAELWGRRWIEGGQAWGGHDV